MGDRAIALGGPLGIQFYILGHLFGKGVGGAVFKSPTLERKVLQGRVGRLFCQFTIVDPLRFDLGAVASFERHLVLDRVFARCNLARSPVLKERFELERAAVRDLERLAIVLGAVLVGVAAIGGVANRDVIGVARERDALRPLVRSRGEGGCRGRDGVGGGHVDLYGHLVGDEPAFSQVVVGVNVIGPGDGALGGERLFIRCGFIEVANRGPGDVVHLGLTALVGDLNLVGKIPGPRWMFGVLPLVCLQGSVEAKVDVAQLGERRLFVGAGVGELDAETRVVAVNVVGGGTDVVALVCNLDTLGEVVFGPGFDCGGAERERCGVVGHVRGLAVLIAFGRPGDLCPVGARHKVGGHLDRL